MPRTVQRSGHRRPVSVNYHHAISPLLATTAVLGTAAIVSSSSKSSSNNTVNNYYYDSDDVKEIDGIKYVKNSKGDYVRLESN